MGNHTVLEVNRLIKRYGRLTAVDGISFRIPAGTCFGLLGPNGAGKTTSIEVIEDVLPPDGGEILYKGRPRSTQFREEVGIQFQETALLQFLTVRETLQTFQKLYRHPMALDDVIALCSLGDILPKYNDRISGGQKKRLLLALALINQPDLVFLDEPSTGLDPQARWDLWNVVRRIKAQGKTIVLTTHYMEEAQQLCDEIAIMDHGAIIAQGAPEGLIDQHTAGPALVLPRKNFPRPPRQIMPGWRTHGQQGELVDLTTDDIEGVLEQLLRAKVSLDGMTIRSPNLEDVFLNLTGRQLRE
jgi:ABC-2 type transport system ATP-binding protein